MIAKLKILSVQIIKAYVGVRFVKTLQVLKC